METAEAIFATIQTVSTFTMLFFIWRQTRKWEQTLKKYEKPIKSVLKQYLGVTIDDSTS